MAKPPNNEPITLKEDIEDLPLDLLSGRLVEALSVDYDDNAAQQCLSYITEEMEDTEELVGDLEVGHEDSGLVDSIMTATGIPSNESSSLMNLLITAVNGDWSNTKVKPVGEIEFYPEYTATSSSGAISTDLQRTKEWLSKQWDDKVFESYDQNLDLMRLFAIGKKQNMASLPGVLHEVYSQWRINYLIERKKKGKKLNAPIIADFISKSKAFNNIHKSHKQLVASGVATYGRRFSPQPVINHLFEIRDSLYQFVLYSYIMSEAIRNMLETHAISLPLQLDFWIIPKKITTKVASNQYDDDDDDDESEDDCKENVVNDTSILDLEARLKLDKDLKYEKFEADLSNDSTLHKLKRTLQRTIQSCLSKDKGNRGGSHNRLVCIVDRRDKYHGIKVLGDKERNMWLNQSALDQSDQKDDANALPPIIEIDETAVSHKKCDEIFVFQPPGNNGVIPHDYSQEHLHYLSKEYMLPKVILKNPEFGYKTICGAYNDFDSQMFAISFCCHSESDIRLQWFINGWNMRIPKKANFTKIWPEFFAKTKENTESIERIQKEILSQWKLPIKNKEYELYEKDLLRWDHKGRRKATHD
eukprot:31175_1